MKVIMRKICYDIKILQVIDDDGIEYLVSKHPFLSGGMIHFFNHGETVKRYPWNGYYNLYQTLLAIKREGKKAVER